MAANGFDAAHQATDETMARARGLTQTSLKPATEAFSKASNAAVQFGHGNLEAMAQSTQIYLTGIQDLSRQYVTAMQGLMQHAFEGAKAFAGATSLDKPWWSRATSPALRSSWPSAKALSCSTQR